MSVESVICCTKRARAEEDLDKARARMGSFNFSAQYQQSPVPLKGEIVRWEWFKFYDQAPPP